MNFLFLSIFVFPYAVLLALAVAISPVLAVLLLAPGIIFIFWVFPNVSHFPKKLLMNLFFAWLSFSILWPSYLSFRLPGVPDIEPSRVVLGILIFIWMFYLIKNPNIRQQITSVYKNNSTLFLFLILIILTQLLSVLFSEFFFQSAFLFIKNLIEVFFPVLILISIFSIKQDLNRFIWFLVLIGSVVVLISSIELIINKNIFALYLPSGFVLSSEFVEMALSEKIRGGEYRVQGPFSHPLLLAQFLVVLLPLYVYCFFTNENKLIKVFLLILIPVTLIVLYKTGSRSVFVAIAVEVVVVAVLYLTRVIINKRASGLGWVVIFSYPIFILLGIFIFHLTFDYFSGQSVSAVNSTNARFLMWEKGLSLIMESPIFGFGVGSAAFVLDFTGGSGVLTIDSYYLSVLLESGYFGFLVFIIYFVLVFKLGFGLIRLKIANTLFIFTIIVAISGYLTVAIILSTPHNLGVLFMLSALLTLYKNELMVSKLGE